MVSIKKRRWLCAMRERPHRCAILLTVAAVSLTLLSISLYQPNLSTLALQDIAGAFLAENIYSSPLNAVLDVTVCTAEELNIIRRQLPSKECVEYKDRPYYFGGLCSFSYATRCPEARWLHDYYRASPSLSSKPRQAIYVGCNKAMDAINTMRMLSMNRKFDKDQWRKVFFNGKPHSAGNCNQTMEANFEIPPDKPVIPVHLHCIEAMPATSRELVRTTHTLNYGSSLHVVNAAMSHVDGKAMFPNSNVGIEGEGLAICEVSTEASAKHCVPVPQYTFDTYAKQHMDLSLPIDFVSIDVEGYDAAVLAGARESLGNVRYLEFEYNWKGAWANHSLSTTIRSLENKGFICYWAGTGGNIWRITGCWLDYYEIKTWSNVACVRNDHKNLLRRMEDYFRKTLEADDMIRFDKRTTAFGDGRMQRN